MKKIGVNCPLMPNATSLGVVPAGMHESGWGIPARGHRLAHRLAHALPSEDRGLALVVVTAVPMLRGHHRHREVAATLGLSRKMPLAPTTRALHDAMNTLRPKPIRPHQHRGRRWESGHPPFLLLPLLMLDSARCTLTHTALMPAELRRRRLRHEARCRSTKVL
eukprot:TRINITY_DN1293_c0_g1_i3.p2 TRINITY_DN1293_c0_g1~~TRINITY_DN1293_c0_g1_i3.p2  ORF type:complete len:164 (+),score=8.01 TRINITY_DN1293_c0_g1_i3:725-1216(+)